MKNNRPLSKQIREFINNYGITAKPVEDQVVTVVDDDETGVDNANVVIDDNSVEEIPNQAQEMLVDVVEHAASGTERYFIWYHDMSLCDKSFIIDQIKESYSNFISSSKKKQNKNNISFGRFL